VLRIVASGMCALAVVLGAALPAAAAPAPAPTAAAPAAAPAPAPAPATATAPAATTVRASGVDLYIDTLSKISCGSAKTCLAIGLYDNYRLGSDAPIAEAWNGKSWRSVAVPEPKGALRRRDLRGRERRPDAARQVERPGLHADENGGLGPHQRNCVAVGTAGTASSVSAQALSCNGTSWSRQRVPAPGKGASSTLSDVSCPRPGDCVAIGEVGDFNLNTATVMPRPMGGWWNGKTWALADA
jgi:hypothetical protein